MWSLPHSYKRAEQLWRLNILITPITDIGAGNKMIDLYVILAMPLISFLVVVIYIIEIPSFYFGNAT